MNFQTLPHKNVIVSAIIALGIFLSAIFFAQKGEVSNDQQTSQAQTSSIAQVATDVDTDHDLLPDWKERLYSSDIRNPDTDHDGTSDGSEVSAGRNPVVPNTAKEGEPPNDKLPYLIDPDFATSTTDMAGLKKEFFAKYLAEGSSNIKETTFRDLVKKVNTKPFIPQHDIVSLNVSSDNTREVTKTYLNAFGVIIKKYLNVSKDKSEDMVIENVLTKNDAGSRAELQLYAVAYKNFAKDLLELRVPSSLAKAHLLIVNGYDGMGSGLLGIGKMLENPIDGAAGYEAYIKYRLDVVSGYATIVNYVIDQKLVFRPDEPGYPFYWNTTAQKVRATK